MKRWDQDNLASGELVLAPGERPGVRVNLVTGGRQDFRWLHTFFSGFGSMFRTQPVAGRTPGTFWGYERTTLELLRIDGPGRAAVPSPGLGALGSPRFLHLVPAGDALLVTTVDHRLVLQPLP